MKTNLFFNFYTCIALLCCASGFSLHAQQAVTVGDTLKHNIPDTITRLQDQVQTISVFKAPNGNYYTVTLERVDEQLVAHDSLYCVTDLYLGTKRKRSKTTLVLRNYKSYSSINALRNTLPTDSIMKNVNISSASNSVRVQQEKKNITIQTAYIYAVSREDDNDFHVIVGDTLPYNASKSINVELSGLPNPPNAASDSLQNARTSFEAFMGEKCSGAYTLFNPPIPIKVSGSLFYDVDHAPGIIGTGIFKPNTSWELHPVSQIIFK
ncbi:MAG: hypothetical protein JNK61_09610 [Bacteroidia bacterium]|nr:hypothetical protein [Bacteroidia bacterium]